MNPLFFPLWPRLATALALAACLFGVPAAQAQAISNSGALSFGAFVAGVGGSVVMTPNGGRSRTGGVMLFPQGSATAAQFNVTGLPLSSYRITLPANGTVVLSDGNNHSMAVNGFVSDPGTTGTLSLGGTQSLRVGATLAVGAAQPPGSYTGSFAVTVNNQ